MQLFIFYLLFTRYSINLQLVCDDKKVIRSYLTGWPGSVYDSTVFGYSDVMKHSEVHFSPQQFLLADAGYTLSNYVCTPYRQPMASNPIPELFNKLFSSARTLIEHTNGILKARWSSLRGIRTQIKKVNTNM